LKQAWQSRRIRHETTGAASEEDERREMSVVGALAFLNAVFAGITRDIAFAVNNHDIARI
jgi:hypothetical protein